LKKAAKATWQFICTPTGAAVSMIGVVTITSGVMLSAQLVDYASIDEREIRLSSNIHTQFDVFSAEYENALGEISVSGMDGNKVIAPGTSEEYTIRLRNADDVAIDYVMVPTVSLLSETSIPIMFRMIDSEENFIIGDSKTWVSVEDFAAVAEENTLRKGESTEYYFQWKWDFESGDDRYDTELGNQGEGLGVKVELNIQSEANTAIAENGGVSESGVGELVASAVSFFMLASAGALFVVMLVLKRKMI